MSREDMLRIYGDYLKKKQADSNYQPTIDESTAEFNVTRDPSFKADLAALQNSVATPVAPVVETPVAPVQPAAAPIEIPSEPINIVPDVQLGAPTTPAPETPIIINSGEPAPKNAMTKKLVFENKPANNDGDEGFVSVIVISVLAMVLGFLVMVILKCMK